MVKFKLTTLRLLLVALLAVAVFSLLYSRKALSTLSRVHFLLIPSEVASLNMTIIDKYYYGGMRSSSASSNEHISCHIAMPPVIPPYFRRHWKPSSFSQDCSYEETILTLENDTVIRLRPGFSSKSCCVHEVTRGRNDNEPSVSECKPVHDGQNVRHMEAFLARCGENVQAEARIPIKPSVQAKLSYWKNFEPAARPPAVFLFGFDSTSRAHAYRSLPKSIDLMMKLGFVDFSAYHSVAPSTLSNFMGLLMGLTRAQVRSSCSRNWTTPFDSCPMIWKDFSSQHYITSYVEDGSQTFNWGDQSGFNADPTDYYLHHLLKALQNAREEGLPTWTHQLLGARDPDCASRETIAKFILKYNMKFISKFADFPFFSFLWFANPFHDNMFALPNFDTEFSQLFQMISGSSKLLENVIFIFLSDHGDRTEFFGERSPESYFERGLPPLFIRLPNKYKRAYPHFSKLLRSNSHKFTTPFDVHETLRHILSRNSTYTAPAGKNKNADRRSSLLATLPSHRTCANTNIADAKCLCNLQLFKNQSLPAPDLRRHILVLLEESLIHINLMVHRSVYRELCSKWTSSLFRVQYVAPLSVAPLVTEALLVFTASPGDAKFEARLRVTFDDESQANVSSVEVVGVSRANTYEDSSYCVKQETDGDKTMREFCYCKIQKRANTLR